MELQYLQVVFNLHFLEKTYIDTNPLFVMRSMLGKNLRSMCCISKTSVCGQCLYNKTCVYSYIFETCLPPENQTLPGRNRGSHPFSLSIEKLQRENPVDDYSFVLTLFGKTVDYLPYIYAAFVRAGQSGIFKARSQFEILSVIANKKNLLIDQNHLDTVNTPPYICVVDNKETPQSGEILIELKSPLRFKVQGKFTLDFTAQDFFNCLYRRAKTLCSLYGEISETEIEGKYVPSPSLKITEKKLKWIDFKHYSARQKTQMELGGIVGSFKIEGEFSEFEMGLLRMNRIAGAGKNTNFGLGQIDFWEKMER